VKGLARACVALLFATLLAPDVALSTARCTLSGGGKAETSGWFTLVFKRSAQGWRAVHDHSS
jgi:ketosteroid isomerase-like protein